MFFDAWLKINFDSNAKVSLLLHSQHDKISCCTQYQNFTFFVSIGVKVFCFHNGPHNEERLVILQGVLFFNKSAFVP